MSSVSENGVNLIKSFEGFRDKAYQDQASIWTIGYGTIKYPDGRKVEKGDECTMQQATEWLTDHISKNAAPAVNQDVKQSLTQNQFDALVSFVYNEGEGNFKQSTLLKRVNENPSNLEIADAFMMWTKVTVNGHKVESAGLKNRRTAEADLYFTH